MSDNSSTPTVGELFADPSAGFIAFVVIDCVLFLLAVALGGFNIHKHLNVPGPAQPVYKRATLIVIATPMVMSFFSLCCLFFPRATVVLELAQSVYEAVALYYFYTILVCMLGGHDKMVEVLGTLPPKNYYSVPVFRIFCCCVSPFKFTPRINAKLKTCVLQICFIRPLMLLVAVLLLASGKYEDGVIAASNGYIFVAIINAISLLVTMFALLVIFMATRQILASFTTTYKLLMIKLVFLLAILQNLLLSFLVRVKAITPNSIFSNPELAEQWLNWILVIELGLISLLFIKAFPETDFALIPKEGELHPAVALSAEASKEKLSA